MPRADDVGQRLTNAVWLDGGGMALSIRRIVAGIGVVAWLPMIAAAQETARVSGRVTGEGGAGLAGVSVSIPELGLGAQSATSAGRAS